MAANILGGTTVKFGAVSIIGVYSIDGPDMASEQVDTTTLDSTTTVTTSPFGATANGKVVRDFTNGVYAVGPITVECDLDKDIAMALPASGSLEIVFNGGAKTWTFANTNLANWAALPGGVPDAMRMNLVFQPTDLPAVAVA